MSKRKWKGPSGRHLQSTYLEMIGARRGVQLDLPLQGVGPPRVAPDIRVIFAHAPVLDGVNIFDAVGS